MACHQIEQAGITGGLYLEGGRTAQVTLSRWHRLRMTSWRAGLPMLMVSAFSWNCLLSSGSSITSWPKMRRGIFLNGTGLLSGCTRLLWIQLPCSSIQYAEPFKYFGVKLSTLCDSAKLFTVFFISLSKVFLSTARPVKLRVTIFRTLTIAIVMHACKRLTTHHIWKLDAFQMPRFWESDMARRK